MWTSTSQAHELIEELSREIVVAIAPEEIDMFEELIQEYYQNPAPPDLTTRDKDDPLGFGIEEILIATTPATAAMVNAVLNHLMEEFLGAFQEQGMKVVRNKLKSLFDGSREDKEKPAPLTREQLQQIKKIARKQAIDFGISPEKAERMANALIGSLALKA